jgi:polar amino acid transport system permease protein
VPTILVIYAVGFGVPVLDLNVISTQGPAVYGVFALVLSYSAYVCEVYLAITCCAASRWPRPPNSSEAPGRSAPSVSCGG